ncbi:Ku protein [Ruania suaedae]|uniref:non-homologous end joining protein Ku n=1 Tax=Ruania suaedae TaxID=2897774 RepID=UPI001E58A830|nr:Ku protein [Ruania suaedae]UFU03668.1 Ku protein [Ruania suaedae]
MARSLWTGALAFGLVNVPVGLYAATEDRSVRFRQFEKGTSARIRYQRVNEETGDEVPYENIVKGYELESGEYVLLEREELDEIAPGRSRVIEITDFVDTAEIDPVYYQRTYYLGPRNESAERAYALLATAMRESGRVGIANFVMRSRQYLAVVRPYGDALALETMHFADEVRDPQRELSHLPTSAAPAGRDIDMATSLIDAMTGPWDPDAYADTYREKVLELVVAKAQGEGAVATGEREESEENVVDLVEALRRSVDESRARRQGGADSPRRSPATPPPEDRLEQMSKSELYDLAQERDIGGRSQMTKKQLVAALSETGSRRRAS